MRFSLLVFFISIFNLPHASAQLDASSALMLNSPATTSSNGREATFENGRYTIRPKSENVVKPVAPKRVRVQETDQNEGPQSPVTVVVPAGQAPEPRQGNDIHETRVYVVPSQQSPSTQSAPQAIPVEANRRFNIIDLSFAPGFLYTNSDSNSFYRRYSTATPSLDVDANLWFNSAFGLHGAFVGTLSGNVNDSFNGSRTVPASHQWFFAGLRSRKFFGTEAITPSLTFGADYFEYEFRVPTDAALRNKLRTYGAQLSIEAEIPVNASRSWTIGGILAPKLVHQESATSASFSSGGNVDANIVGISIGARYQFERRDALFWKISHRIEKDLFSGEATQNDPLTGITPSGVAVTNSFTLIELGYAWGN